MLPEGEARGQQPLKGLTRFSPEVYTLFFALPAQYLLLKINITPLQILNIFGRHLMITVTVAMRLLGVVNNGVSRNKRQNWPKV